MYIQNTDNHNITGGKRPVSEEVRSSLRDSSMELLRIVAMSMIVIHHFVVHGSTYSWAESGLGLQNSFIYYGVNLFILISGYYGIRVRWKSFLSLLVTVMFFLIIDSVGDCVAGWINDGNVNFNDLLRLRRDIYRPFTQWWFISCYVMLYMSVPVINLGLHTASRQQLRGIAAVVFCYSVYAALVGDYASSAGRMLPQFLMLYIIGYWIRVDRPFNQVSVPWLVVIAVASSLFNGFIWQALLGSNTGLGYSVHYANVLCLVGSVTIFLVFTRFSFRSRFVNSVAGASLGCYLLQDGDTGPYHIYVLQKHFFVTHPFAESLLMYAVSFVALWAASWALTWFKNLWAPALVNGMIRFIPSRFKRDIW